MQISPSPKYGFRIRTRGGVLVENLLIAGKDEPDAERKLRQIYQGCEILEAKHQVFQISRNGLVNYEDVVELIVSDDPNKSFE